MHFLDPAFILMKSVEKLHERLPTLFFKKRYYNKRSKRTKFNSYKYRRLKKVTKT